MAAYTQEHDSQYYSRRIIVFIAAVAIQVFILLALNAGMAQRVMNIIAPPIQTNIVQQVEKHDQPPPPPPPKLERPPVEVPPPEVQINMPTETRTTAITDVTNRHVAPAPRPVPVHRAVIVGARLDQRHSPTTDDYYPPVSRRLEEQGTTTVHVCSDPSGRPAGLPTVQKSSGSPRLDEAAVKWASHARYFPGTEDGKPIASCTEFRVKFVLTD